MRRAQFVVAALLLCAVALLPTPGAGQAAGGEQALRGRAQAALAAKNWQQAADALGRLVALDPRWDHLQSLGDAESNLGRYQEALDAYDRGIRAAQADRQAPASRTRSAIAAMWTGKGNDFLKMRRPDEAIDAYTKAAGLSPNPGLPYFNLCATQYNLGRTEGALAACDKAIKADPGRADAYFIKGSLLVAQATTGKDGKTVAPPGTIEALRKYLELAPDGAHVRDVREMLDYSK